MIRLSEEAVFQVARRIDRSDARRLYLEQACGSDADLRTRVEALLRAHDDEPSFLERPVVTPPAVGPETRSFAHGPDTPAGAYDGSAAIAGTVIAGRYKLLEQIGEGGMGTVFMAEQTAPVRRNVALKILKTGIDTRQVVARFEAERQALALMDHPNIARVYDGGEDASGRPYFVMELVRGVPITDFCDQSRLPVRERLELFAIVCRAVQHAHQKGVIHRDLKPSNVLVTVHDGVPVPKVIDFGIAKAVDQPLTEQTLFTNFAQMIGTPLYMSPEQAEMSGLGVDTRTDVYALGVLLYELLTGTTPLDREQFRTARCDEIRRLIREEEPARPSTRIGTLGDTAATVSAARSSDAGELRRLVRGELDWVVMTCLEKDRNHRYESASALAADIQRFLSDEPVQACPPSTWYRFHKFARRNWAALAIATAAVLVVVAGMAGLSVSNLLITQEQRETAKALDDANAASDELKRINGRERVEGYFRSIALSDAALSVNDLDGALKYLDQCPEDLRGWEWCYLMRLCCVDPVVIRDSKAVHGVAFSTDAGRLATAGGDGAVRVWDGKTGNLVREIKKAHDRFACCVAFHPGGGHLVSVGADGRAKVWDLTADPPRVVFERPCDAVHPFGTAYAAVFSPRDPDHLAFGCAGTVTIWNWRTEMSVHTFPGHETDRVSVAFSPDGRRLATGNWLGTVRLWDPVAGGGPLHTLTRPGGTRHPVAALAFAPDGARLAAAGFARRVEVWDTSTGRLLDELPHRGGLVLGVAFGRDGLLATVGEDKVVRIWSAAGRELLALRGHTGMCGCVAYSPDGLRLVSAGSDRTVRLWDATPLRGDERMEAASFEEHGDEVWSVAVNPAGPGVVSAGWNMPSAMVWDARTRRLSARFGEHGVVVFCVAWHPDGRHIASAGSADGQFTVKVWEATTGETIFTLRDSSRLEFLNLAFSPDGRHMVTGRGSGAVQVWDARTGREVGTLGTHNGPVRGVVFSPDGRHLATASADGEVKLWDATWLGEKLGPQQPHRTFLAHSPGVGVTVAFSPDGKRLVMGDKGYTVKICDADTGEELLVLRGHNGDVHAVAVSPDGRWVASGGEDSTVKVWSARSGNIVRTFRGHRGLVSSLAFVDGRTLISGSRDRTVKLWDVTQLEEVADR